MVAPVCIRAMTVECIGMERYVGTRILFTGETISCTCMREIVRTVQNRKTAAKMDSLDMGAIA